MKETRRIDKKSSRTASYTCMCRAASFMEKNPNLKSDDYIAVRLLPGFVRFLLRHRIISLRGRLSPRGIYPYVIARTKYIDDVFNRAINDGFEQVLIMGAGFDSRAIRFSHLGGAIRVFEVDTHYTQNAKIQKLHTLKIPIPDNVIFVPMNFEKEDMAGKLTDCQFNPALKTLFILEGLIMYLSKDAVAETFDFIHSHSPAGSWVVFDYVYADVLRREHRRYGEEDIYRKVKNAQEGWTFGIEQDSIGSFLGNHHFTLTEHLDSEVLENRYFRDEFGEIQEKVNGTHCIVLAQRDN